MPARASGSPSVAPGPGSSLERLLQLSRLQYRPELLVELDRALGRAAGTPGAGGHRGRPDTPASPVTGSFVGALARLPDQRARELVALLEVCTFPRLVGAIGPGRPGVSGRRLQALEQALQDRVRALEAQKGAPLRAALACAMARRLAAVAPGLPRDVAGLVSGLLERLGQEFGLRSGRHDESLLKQVLLAAGRYGADPPDLGGLGALTRRLLARLTLHGAVAGAVLGLAYAGRRRLSLTVATVAYVLSTGLLGLQLPFAAYEWVARAVLLVLEPAVLAASSLALGTRALTRCQRRFDAAVLGHVLCRIYQSA